MRRSIATRSNTMVWTILLIKVGMRMARMQFCKMVWQQNYSIAASGGTENSKYRFSAGYLNQDGIVTNTSFKKYTPVIFLQI